VAALGAVVLFALVIRLAGIGDRLSNDEGYTWLVSSAPSWGAFLHRLAAYENTPPLLYLLGAPLPDDHEWWLRAVPTLAGTASVAVLYAIVRPLLGTRTALLAALLLAVAPYHVSFSDYSRAFTLAGLGVLLALWGAARLAEGRGRRWWWLWAAGALIALYSEFDAGLMLALIAGALLVLGRPPRRETLLLAPAPLLGVLPWAHQIARSLDALDHTKVAPRYPGPGLRSLRDVFAPLLFGEHGSSAATDVRDFQLLIAAIALGVSARLLWRAGRRAFWLLAAPVPGAIVVYGAVHAVGPDVFAQRYMTAVIPFCAAVFAAGLAALPWRRGTPVAAAGLVLFGAGVFAYRSGRELEPSLAPVRAAVARSAAGPVATNSAVVAYYLRDRDVVLDRPFGLGPGCGTCPVVVDDARIAGGVRPGPGATEVHGPFTVRFVHSR
jgi:4-amino-4-deoxy-L-arabinose transferase-like glycosyltransferase